MDQIIFLNFLLFYRVGPSVRFKVFKTLNEIESTFTGIVAFTRRKKTAFFDKLLKKINKTNFVNSNDNH